MGVRYLERDKFEPDVTYILVKFLVHVDTVNWGLL